MIHETSPVFVLVTSLQNVTKNLIYSFIHDSFQCQLLRSAVLFFLQIPHCKFKSLTD